MNSSQLANILLKNSTNRFYIVYEGYLVNHISHGIIALARLGANAERIERFIEWYRPRLEDPRLYRSTEKVDNHAELLGKGKYFYVLVDHYNAELEKCAGSIERLVADKFPKLFPGLLGAALHGVIQLGYGYAARSAPIVCEGLAYTHFSYLPLEVSAAASKFASEDIGKGRYSVLEVANRIQNDTELIDFMNLKSKSEEFTKLNIGEFSCRAKSLYKYRGDNILQYAYDVRIPTIEEIERLDVEQQCNALLRWLLDTAVTVYALTKKQDFFLLHGVTSAWSVLQVGALSVSWSRVLTLELVQSLLCAVIATYISQQAPALQIERLEQHSCEQISWSALIEKVLAKDLDEHVYKLIQICYELSQGTSDQDLKKLYHLAAARASDEEFVF